MRGREAQSKRDVDLGRERRDRGAMKERRENEDQERRRPTTLRYPRSLNHQPCRLDIGHR